MTHETKGLKPVPTGDSSTKEQIEYKVFQRDNRKAGREALAASMESMTPEERQALINLLPIDESSRERAYELHGRMDNVTPGDYVEFVDGVALNGRKTARRIRGQLDKVDAA